MSIWSKTKSTVLSRPWIYVRGREYAEELVDGIDHSTAIILLMSENANHSPDVLREVERAVSKSISILVYKLEETPLSKSMEYFLMTHQ